MGLEESIKICVQLLGMYNIDNDINKDDLTNFKIIKSQIYGFANIYSFDYKNNHYYVCDDPSLMDNPKYIEDVLEEINPLLKGRPIENPITQSDGAIYASGLNGTEYYLWEVLLNHLQ